MSLILVATWVVYSSNTLVGCPPDGRVGIRRGGARDTAGNGERAAHRRVRPTIMPDPRGALHAQLRTAAPRRAVGARSDPRRALVGLVADPSRGRAVPVVGARPLVAPRRRVRRDRAVPALVGDRHERRSPGLNHLAFHAGKD